MPYSSSIGADRGNDPFRQQAGSVIQFFQHTFAGPVDVRVVFKDDIHETHPEHGGAPHVFYFRQSLQIGRSEEHTSELQSLMRISYAVFCLKKKKMIIKKYNIHSQYLQS